MREIWIRETLNESVSMNAPNRVLVTRGDGLAPMVSIPQGGTLRGVWLGGVRGALTEIQPEDDVVIENCVFFGYEEGVNVAGGKRVIIRNNLFYNCGAGFYSHPIYVNNFAADIGEGTLIDGNVFINCAGYSIHLWHHPPYNTIVRNFIARAVCGIAQQGNFNAFYNNIVWDNGRDVEDAPNKLFPSVYLDEGKNLNFNHNLFGLRTRDALLHHDADAVVRNNGFVANGCAPFGTSPQTYAVRELKKMLGYSRAQIDRTIDEICLAFSQGAGGLLENDTLESNVERLRAVVKAWESERK